MEIIGEYGSRASDTVIIQLTGDHELSLIENEIKLIRELADTEDFRLIPVRIDDWNKELSPWESPAVFGDESFGSGAENTLENLLKEVLPQYTGRIYLGGYSLAGLFALWACCNTDVFSGVAAVSPSAWFPGFVDYVRDNTPRTGAVYLSLGTKEEKTKNRTMATVGDCIRSIYENLKGSGIETVLEWNRGNHFAEPDLRMAKGFARLIK